MNLHPGPNNASILFLHQEHRARDVFLGGPGSVKPMKIRRGDQALWEYLKSHRLPSNVKSVLDGLGLGGVIECGNRTVDHALMHALVERWRPETHTFHLPVGEASVTLQDVNVLWGLPIEGEPITGIDVSLSKEEIIDMCQRLLGITIAITDVKGKQ